jgi:uncharacterized membrane protein YqiK
LAAKLWANRWRPLRKTAARHGGAEVRREVEGLKEAVAAYESDNARQWLSIERSIWGRELRRGEGKAEGGARLGRCGKAARRGAHAWRAGEAGDAGQCRERHSRQLRESLADQIVAVGEAFAEMESEIDSLKVPQIKASAELSDLKVHLQSYERVQMAALKLLRLQSGEDVADKVRELHSDCEGLNSERVRIASLFGVNDADNIVDSLLQTRNAIVEISTARNAVNCNCNCDCNFFV